MLRTINFVKVTMRNNEQTTLYEFPNLRLFPCISSVSFMFFPISGQSFIVMGQVDEDGRGILHPGSFTAIYKAQHHKILNSLTKQPC